MAENEPKVVEIKPGQVVVDEAQLTAILEKQSLMEKQLADEAAKREGLQELFESQAGPDTTGEKKLREKKNYEPAFRTVRIRKFPIAGDPENLGYVIGWSNRGAYQKVDRTGVAPVLVDYIDVMFLGHERNAEGKLQAESIPLLDLLNRGEQVHCKVLSVDKNTRKEPTGEEINVTTWDPQHGLVATGDVIDGYVAYTDMEYTIQIPGTAEPVKIDSKFIN